MKNEDIRQLVIDDLTIEISESLMTTFVYDGLVEMVVPGGKGELPPIVSYRLTPKGILTFVKIGSQLYTALKLTDFKGD